MPRNVQALEPSEKGLQLIGDFEGFSAHPYKVGGRGKNTIGYGHEELSDDEEDFSQGITKAQALQLLKQDA